MVISDIPQPLTLRERTRQAVRHSIQETASVLFAQHGYEATTVDQIARTAGMSERSFFRYFASKEDLVIGELAGLTSEVVETFRARPAEEDLWAALRQCFTVFYQLYDDSDPRGTRPLHVLIDTSPALSAAYLLAQSRLRLQLTAIARKRTALPGLASPSDPRLDAVVGAGIACLEAAERAWLASNIKTDFSDLLDQAMQHLDL